MLSVRRSVELLSIQPFRAEQCRREGRTSLANIAWPEAPKVISGGPPVIS
jgi:hypothetical protein